MAQRFNSPQEAAVVLIADQAHLNPEGVVHENAGSRLRALHAQYKAAEMEAWGQWERAEKHNEQGNFWSQAARIISDEYSKLVRESSASEQKSDSSEAEPALVD